MTAWQPSPGVRTQLGQETAEMVQMWGGSKARLGAEKKRYLKGVRGKLDGTLEGSRWHTKGN